MNTLSDNWASGNAWPSPASKRKTLTQPCCEPPPEFPLIVPFTYIVHHLSGLHIEAPTQTTCKLTGDGHTDRETDTHTPRQKHTHTKNEPLFSLTEWVPALLPRSSKKLRSRTAAPPREEANHFPPSKQNVHGGYKFGRRILVTHWTQSCPLATHPPGHLSLWGKDVYALCVRSHGTRKAGRRYANYTRKEKHENSSEIHKLRGKTWPSSSLKQTCKDVRMSTIPWSPKFPKSHTV